MMKYKCFIISAVTSLCTILACTAKTDGFQSVGVEDFANVLSDSSVVCLDVRTIEEYAEGHIVGAENIDVLQHDFESKVVSLPKDKIVCVYCRSGNRSKKAAAILVKHGYKTIELSTGYKGWSASGKPTER